MVELAYVDNLRPANRTMCITGNKTSIFPRKLLVILEAGLVDVVRILTLIYSCELEGLSIINVQHATAHVTKKDPGPRKL